MERLNEIIHLSTLTSRFVSMVYGELEASGNFVYVNCGHPPPFRVAADGKEKLLERGGIVLGPIPDATYERGFVKIRPGDLLVLYTDGIVEGTGSVRREASPRSSVSNASSMSPGRIDTESAGEVDAGDSSTGSRRSAAGQRRRKTIALWSWSSGRPTSQE